jgi:hypothetical protein
VPSGSEVQVRTTHSWLVGFFQWIVWLFRRGGASETTPTDLKDSANARASASDLVNGNTGVTKTSHQSEAVPKSTHSNSATDAIQHNQGVELTEESRSKDESKPLASEGLRTLNDGAVQTKHVQAFLERLPEIQRQLLEAETAPGKALAEFMAKLMPTRMKLRAPLRALRDRLRGHG